MSKRLKAEAIQAIRDHSGLYIDICKILDVKPGSLPKILDRNGNNINRYDVVELVANHMGIDPGEAVEEFDEVGNEA